MDYKKMPKNAENFYCEKCDFVCSKKSNYVNHLLESGTDLRYIQQIWTPLDDL